MFIFYNQKHKRKLVDDCVVRAICKVTGKTWHDDSAQNRQDGKALFVKGERF